MSGSGGSSSNSSNNDKQSNGLGKAVGTAIGTIVGGPLGGVLGSWIGGQVGNGSKLGSSGGNSSGGGSYGTTTSSGGGTSSGRSTGFQTNKIAPKTTATTTPSGATWKDVKLTDFNNPLTYERSDEYQHSLDNLQTQLNQPDPNGATATLGNYYNKVLGEDYSAYSPEQMQQMKDTAFGTLKDEFKKQEAGVGAHLANQGLAGSGVGQMAWTSQAEGENKALADVWNSIQSENRAATRQDVNNMLQMSPQLFEMQQQKLRDQEYWNRLMAQENQNMQNVNQYNQDQKFQIWQNENDLQRFNATNELQANEFNIDSKRADKKLQDAKDEQDQTRRDANNQAAASTLASIISMW